VIRAPTTRVGLLEVCGRRGVAPRGARLLRAKREVLASELWKLVQEVLAGRARLDEALAGASTALQLACALDGGATALASLAGPAAREIPVDVTVRREWDVATPSLSAPPVARTADGRGTSVTSWGLAGAEAARRHEVALDVILGIASRELHLSRRGDEIQETSRRINALEQLVLPALAAEASRVASALSERDREDAVRLKRLRARRQRG
jgi:V/A-type H+/Na+-transporting ATPase subunit D